MAQPAPYAIVLAAGAGSRFGGDKLLAPFRGKPLVAHTALAVAEAIAAGTLAGGVAVVPAGDTRLGWHFDTAGLSLVENPQAASGMASSLRRGIGALESSALDPPAGAAVIVLADQPLQRPETIARLVEAWRRHGGSVRPRYRRHPDQPGHPVLLDRGLWAMLESLSGDEGFGAIFRQQPEAVTMIDLPGANPDMDRPGDLQQFEESDG